MQVHIANEYLRVTAQTFGAELMHILAADGTEYLWQGDKQYWAGRSPTLFPYVARLTNGTYSLDGKTYAMAIHGLAPYAEFAPTETTVDSMTLIMTDNESTRASFPRAFRFSVTYGLSGKTLAVTYTVQNTDDKPLYFGLGGHPGFRVPLARGKAFSDYRLRFGSKTRPVRIGFNTACFRDGNDTPFTLRDGMVLPLRHDLFDEDAIVLKDMARSVTLETDGDRHSVTVSYPAMPYLGVWHMPRTDAPYVCIEPWCSLPSSEGEETVFEQRADLIRVEPGARYDNTWTMTFGM